MFANISRKNVHMWTQNVNFNVVGFHVSACVIERICIPEYAYRNFIKYVGVYKI